MEDLTSLKGELMGNKLFNRGLAFALTAALASTTMLTGCGSGENSKSSTTSAGSQAASATASASKTSTASFETEKKVEETMRNDISSIDLTKDMGNGINLGNTMEAYNHSALMPASGEITADMVTKCETAWGQPVTTQEMIDGMKSAGFDTLRIPVAWTNLMDYENNDYTIPAAYMARVKEIVDYARADDMYVIINDHWDGDWWGMFGQKGELAEKAWDMYEQIWTQISTEFKDYGDHVIFESANEELGARLNDKWPQDDTGVDGTLTEDECYSTMNKINQKFVDVIRASGGNNENRFLLIAGYDTNIDKTLNFRFNMPKDTATDKLLISVHFYDPSDYCIGTVATWGKQKQLQAVNDTLAKMKTYVDRGIGVVIGEYGPQADKETLKDGTPLYIRNLLNNCDYYNYCPVLWDCNSQYDRDNCRMSHDEVAKIYSDHSRDAQAGKSDDDIKAAAKSEMDADLAAAPAAREIPDDEAFSWLMFASSDWGMMYSVGDKYDEDSVSAGVTATTVDVTGEGEYEVGLDFTGTEAGSAKDLGFSAVGIMNGEQLFPDYSILIEEITINGEKVKLTGNPYTCSDDGKCTRVNIVNPYIKESLFPDGYSAAVIDTAKYPDIKTINVKYKFVNGKDNRATAKSEEETADPTDTKTNAWLMYSNTDWSVTSGTTSNYEEVADVGGVKSTPCDMDGEGEYTVSLDFTGTEKKKTSDPYLIELVVGKAANFKDYVITPTKVLINDKEITLKGDAAQGSESGSYRVYFMNPWGDDKQKIISTSDFKDVETMTVTFTFKKK